MSRRFSSQAVYRRYDRLLRVATFRRFVEKMLARAAIGDPESILRKDRYLELRGKGWSLENAFKYASDEGAQRRNDVDRYGPCSTCGIRAKRPSGLDCEECAP